MAGLNLLAAIIIYWNTAHLGEAVRQRQHAGLTVDPNLLAHISPPWVGPHPPNRRIPVAKAPMATLAYDSAPYRDRPGVGPARRISQVNVAVRQFTQTQVLGQGGWQQQAGIGHQAVVVEGDADAVRSAADR